MTKAWNVLRISGMNELCNAMNGGMQWIIMQRINNTHKKTLNEKTGNNEHFFNLIIAVTELVFVMHTYKLNIYNLFIILGIICIIFIRLAHLITK